MVKKPVRLVSIVVPCRNEKDHIETCVRSILNQDCPLADVEVIVVDGMSDDGTRSILTKMVKGEGRLRIVDNPSRTTPSAFNIGIKAACGEYIAILGAHAEYAPDYVHRCVEILGERTEVCCVGGPIISQGKSLFGQAVAAAMSHPIGVGNAKHRFPDYEGYADAVCFPVFRREIFEKVGLFDERLLRNQDDEFYYRVAQAGERFFLSTRARCTYFVRDTPSQLLRQYFQYGFWRFAVMRKHRRPASARQLVPAIFMFLLLTGSIAGLVLPGWWRLVAVGLPIAYGSTLLAAAVSVMRKNNVAVGLLFPVAATTMHFAYGLGFLVGLSDDSLSAFNKLK